MLTCEHTGRAAEVEVGPLPVGAPLSYHPRSTGRGETKTRKGSARSSTLCDAAQENLPPGTGRSVSPRSSSTPATRIDHVGAAGTPMEKWSPANSGLSLDS